MTYNSINLDVLSPSSHAHVPAIGGVDTINPKSLVPPGSLEDCMNFEVSVEAGYTLAAGLHRWSGKTNAEVRQWFVADISDTTGPLTFRRGGIYTVESTITGDTAKIKILDINDAVTQIKFQVISGEWYNSVYEDFNTVLGGSAENFITSGGDQFRVLQTP